MRRDDASRPARGGHLGDVDRQADGGRRSEPAAWSESGADDAPDTPDREDAAVAAGTPDRDRREAAEQRQAGQIAAGQPDEVSVRRGWRAWACAAAILIVLVGGFSYYRHRGASGGKPPGQAAQDNGVPVQAAAAETADVPIYLDSLGTVQALNTVTVKTRVEGQIVQIAFTEGQMVREGDLLAQIDPRPYQAALDQAIARKAQDEATLANTRLDLERTQKLGDYATRQALDTQRSNVGSQTAQIAYDAAVIENARTQLDYATIRSPLTGRTGLRLIDQGNIVRPTDTGGLVDIAQIEPIAVLFTAPEQQLPEVARSKAGGSVPVTALSSDGKTVLGEGELVLINNQVDAASGTIRLKAQFANGQDRLWPGLSVNTRLRLKTLNGVVTIPSAAVQRGPDQLYVYVVKADGTAEKRVVRIGVFSEDKAVVEDGLRAGDKVVTAGQYRVTPGARLAVAAPPGASPPGASPPGPAPGQTAASN